MSANWVGLFLLSESDTTVVDWRYLSDTAQLPSEGLNAATLHFSVPTTPETYQFRFFADNSYNRLAISAPVVVPATTAQIAVNGIAPPTPTSVEPGSLLTVGITGGPANATDWVALAPAGSPDSSYLAWQYLNGSASPPSSGLSSATVTFTLPATAGAYEVRLFAHNSYQRITTSAAIMASDEPPAVAVALTSPFPDTTFRAPATVTLSATASIDGGTISRIDFYSAPQGYEAASSTGTALLGTASAPPYQISWVTPSEGRYFLTAVAVDSTNTATTSAKIRIAIAPPGSVQGTLGAPIADPPSGVYFPGQSVALVAAPGATIRYTTDGTEPTETSSIYTTPLTVAEPITIRARAYQADWTKSAIATHVYRIDTTAPTIVATITPAPNPAGWNNTPVSVSFECFDESAVASCPASAVVTQDGAGQLLTVSAVDILGFQRDLTVTINIDSQPPIVSLISPTAAVSTTEATVVMSGSASDSGSGLGSASCNGQWANPTGGAFSCTVPLVPGQNTLIASAVDLAGNSASAGIRATRITPPAALSISPTTVALAVGDTKTLTVTTDTGLPAMGLTWESSNPSAVAIGPDNDGTITAETLGVSTITVFSGELTAEAVVRVLPSGVSIGESVWTTAPSPGQFVRGAMRANRVLDEDPDLFTLEAESYESTSVVVKGIRGVDGATLWTQKVDQAGVWPPNFQPVPDAFGGLLVKGQGGFIAEYPEYPAGTLKRIGNDVVAPWEFVSKAHIGSVAAAPDGTVYLVEFGNGRRGPPSQRFPEGTYDGEAFIVALDGRTGTVKFRLPVPMQGRWVFTERTNLTEGWHAEDVPPWVEPVEQCEVADVTVIDAGQFGPVLVLPNGDAFVQQIVQDYRNTTRCPGLVPGTAFEHNIVTLWHVTSQGALSSSTLADWSGTFPTDLQGSFDPVGQEYFFQGPNSPDGIGGVLAAWERLNYDGTMESLLTHVSAAGGMTTRPGAGVDMVTSEGTAYLQEVDIGLVARDTSTWAALWPTPLQGTPAYGLNNGGLVVIGWDDNYSPLVQEISAAGAVVQSYPTTIYSPLIALRDQGVLHGIGITGALEAISVPISAASVWSFQSGAFSSCQLELPFFAAKPPAGPSITFGFDSSWTAAMTDPKLQVEDAVALWAFALQGEQLDLHFAPANLGQKPTVLFKSGVPSSGRLGETVASFNSQTGRITTADIIFSNDPAVMAQTLEMYRKVALHELGHLMGLDHPPMLGQSTVMNFAGGMDDRFGWLPLTVTACDAKRAKQAYHRSWP